MSTDFGLPGRVAIVTGAARGLGAATAELFVRFGAHVVACDIDGEALGESVSGLEGERHVAIACDLSRPGNCESLVAETLERHNRLDILVNVAGIIERLVALIDRVPEAVEVGLHLCYGDISHRHWKEPDTAVMVGDFRYDLEAGRRAGAATIYYDAQNQDLWTADADIRVQSHAELLTLIRGEQP